MYDDPVTNLRVRERNARLLYRRACADYGFVPDAPVGVVSDRLRDDAGREAEAELMEWYRDVLSGVDTRA